MSGLFALKFFFKLDVYFIVTLFEIVLLFESVFVPEVWVRLTRWGVGDEYFISGFSFLVEVLVMVGSMVHDLILSGEGDLAYKILFGGEVVSFFLKGV